MEHDGRFMNFAQAFGVQGLQTESDKVLDGFYLPYLRLEGQGSVGINTISTFELP